MPGLDVVPQHSQSWDKQPQLATYLPSALWSGMSIARTEAWEVAGMWEARASPVPLCPQPLRPLDQLDETVPCERISTS